MFPHKRGQYYNYKLIQLHSQLVNQDTEQKIVDTHFEEVVVMSSPASVSLQAADTVITG
jgi:hypothetical protein